MAQIEPAGTLRMTLSEPWVAVARAMAVLNRLGGGHPELVEIFGGRSLDAMCAGHEGEMQDIVRSMMAAAPAAKTAKGKTRRPRRGKG